MTSLIVPAWFIAVVRLFHDSMLARVEKDGDYAKPFPETNGVKQGCVLPPTTFSMLISAMHICFFRTVMMASQSITAMMASCSTKEGCKPYQRCRQTCQMSFSMSMTGKECLYRKENTRYYGSGFTSLRQLGLKLSTKNTEVCTSQHPESLH